MNLGKQRRAQILRRQEDPYLPMVTFFTSVDELVEKLYVRARPPDPVDLDPSRTNGAQTPR